MITFVRVDNRLIHGQVVEAWLPHLKVARVVVADDEAASSPLVRAAMGLAVPASVEVRIEPLNAVAYAELAGDAVKTLFLFRDIADVVKAHEKGLAFTRLNLGNVHFSAGRTRVSASVFLSPEELGTLRSLSGEGVAVEARGVPSDAPVDMADIITRFEKGS